MPHLPFSSKDDLNNSFWENIHFDGGGFAWCEPNDLIIHPPRTVAFILFILFFKTILVENIQCGKELNLFHPPKQQRRPLPSLLPLSFFYVLQSTCFIANVLLSKLKPRLCSSPFTISSTSYVIGMFALYHSSPCRMVRYINEPPLKNEPQHL